MIFRDLEKVRVIVKTATDLDISYAYDDLVFPDHSAFIIQYDDNDVNNFFCFFHQDCIPGDKKKIFNDLKNACNQQKCTLMQKGSYFFKQKGEEVEIHFV